MSAVERFSSNDVDSLDAALGVLARMEATIGASDDADALKDVADQARLVMEMERIRKLGIDLHRAALRVAILAWRRIGQLGAEIGSTGERQTARTLAKASIDQIEDLLSTFTGRSPAVFAATLAKRLRDRADAATLRDLGAGPAPSGDSYTAGDVDISNVQHAAALILGHICDTGEGFTVPAAAEEILRQLGVGSTSLTSLAAQELVRSVISAGADEAEDGAPPEECPFFVTYRSEGGWIRIPWRNATVDQLIWMAEYRKAQAEHALRAAERIYRSALWFEQRCGGDLEARLGVIAAPVAVSA